MGLVYVALVVLGLFALAPFVVLVFNALKSNSELGQNPIGPPLHPVFANFPRAWELGNLATTVRNSAILATGTIVGVCFIAGCAAFALTRLRTPGASAVMFYLFAGAALPAQLFLIPLFYLWTKLHLVDSLVGLIVIYWGIFSPFATLLLRSYFLTIPKEFDEAARIDGASELQVLWQIILPLARPGFLTVGLVSGLAAWNEFFYALTFITSDSNKPITTSFLNFQNNYTTDWGLTAAAGLMIVAPVVLLFLLLQRRFIAGFTATGLRG